MQGVFLQHFDPTVVCNASLGPMMDAPQKKLRVLCLHSWRTSGDIFIAQWKRAGLDVALADLLELVSCWAADCSHGFLSPQLLPARGTAPPHNAAGVQLTCHAAPASYLTVACKGSMVC